MRIIHTITLSTMISLYSFGLEAQPLLIRSIAVDTFYYKNKPVYFKAFLYDYEKNTNIYKYSKREKNNLFTIPINTNNVFIYKNDTMKIKLLYYNRLSLPPIIQKLNFQNGNFIIDLETCTKEKELILKDFPCDCIQYRKEEDQK